VRKLLALATSANPYEAAAAMGRAQELMSRYRIDAASVQDDAAPIEAVTSRNLMAVVGGRVIPSWMNILAVALAEANGLKTYWSWEVVDERRVRCLRAVGQPSVVAVAGYAFQYVAAEIERLARTHTGQGRTWLNNFRLGAAQAVAAKVGEQAEATCPSEPTDEEGLVATNALATVASEVRRQAGLLGLVSCGGVMARYNNEARAAGARAGAGINARPTARPALGAVS